MRPVPCPPKDRVRHVSYFTLKEDTRGIVFRQALTLAFCLTHANEQMSESGIWNPAFALSDSFKRQDSLKEHSCVFPDPTEQVTWPAPAVYVS